MNLDIATGAYSVDENYEGPDFEYEPQEYGENPEFNPRESPEVNPNGATELDQNTDPLAEEFEGEPRRDDNLPRPETPEEPRSEEFEEPRPEEFEEVRPEEFGEVFEEVTEHAIPEFQEYPAEEVAEEFVF